MGESRCLARSELHEFDGIEVEVPRHLSMFRRWASAARSASLALTSLRSPSGETGSISHSAAVLARLRAAVQHAVDGVNQDALVAAAVDPHTLDPVAALQQLLHDRLRH